MRARSGATLYPVRSESVRGFRPRAQRLNRPEQATASQADQPPRSVKQQPHRDGEQQCKQYPVDGEREGGYPVREGRAHQAGVGMQCQIAELMKQIAVQRVEGALQSLHSGDERLDDAAFQVERRVLAVQVILNQLADIALIELVGDSLPGLEIESGLIEPTPQALAVLRDETRHPTPRVHREIRRAHVLTPVTVKSRMPSSAFKKKITDNLPTNT